VAALKTRRRHRTCTPASSEHGDKFSLLEILSGIPYHPVPGMKKNKFTDARRVTKISINLVYPFILNLTRAVWGLLLIYY
jgi:hypothetical protein